MGDQTNQASTSTSGEQDQSNTQQAQGGKTFTREQLDAIIADRL